MGINTNTHSKNLENYLFWDLNNVKNKGNLGGLKAKLHKPKDLVNVRVHVTQFENGQRCNQIQNLNSNITLQDESLNLHIEVDISNEEYHANILEHSMTRVTTFIVFIYLFIYTYFTIIYNNLKYLCNSQIVSTRSHIFFFHENMKLDQHRLLESC